VLTTCSTRQTKTYNACLEGGGGTAGLPCRVTLQKEGCQVSTELTIVWHHHGHVPAGQHIDTWHISYSSLARQDTNNTGRHILQQLSLAVGLTHAPSC
jgi:hypothetical protein